MGILASSEVEIGVLHKHDDGIIEICLSEGTRIDRELIDELLRAQFELTGDWAAVLVDARGVLSMTRASQEHIANNPVNDRTAATAILVANPVSTFLGNFFIRFGRPPYPTKLFRNKEKAWAWLLEHLERGRGERRG